MNKRILILSFLLLQIGFVSCMETPEQNLLTLPAELWTIIFKSIEDSKNKDGGQVSAKEMGQLVFGWVGVCKYFRCIFWNCFTPEQKEDFIYRLFRIGVHKDCIADLAVELKVPLFNVLYDCVYQSCSLPISILKAVVDVVDVETMQQTAVHYKMTPMCAAVAWAPLDKIKLLLSCPNVDVNKTEPLYTAVFRGDIAILKLLLAHPETQINKVSNDFGDTALFAIAESDLKNVKNLRTIIDLLLNAGIDISIKNKDGLTALEVVRGEARPVIADELEKALRMRNLL